MIQRLPVSFFAPIPGIWQLFFWGGASLLGLLPALAFLSDPNPNTGGAAVGFFTTAVFMGFGIATWLERRRRKQPALVIMLEGLSLWARSRKEVFLPWSELEKAWISEGQDPHVVFQPRDLKLYGSSTLLFFRAGPSVPLKTATKDGILLTDVLETFWDQCDPHRTKVGQ